MSPVEFRGTIPYEVIERRPRGQLLVAVACPFCGEDVVGFAWSLAGNGKRCACDAVVSLFSARRKREDTPGPAGGSENGTK